MMCRRKKAILVLALLVFIMSLSACSSNEQDKVFDELTKKPDSSKPTSIETARGSSAVSNGLEPTPYVDPEGLEGEFTVLCYMNSGTGVQRDNVEVFAEEFMALHPGVKINVEYVTDINSQETRQERRDKYCAQVLTELGSGEADYILYSPIEELNIYRLSESGVLLDLHPYFENDPAIDSNDYYSQVLDALSVDGKLTTMPISFCFEGVFLNRPLMEEMKVDLDAIKSVDYQMLLDWYEQAKAIDPEVQVTFGALTQSYLYKYEAPAYVDLENSTALFDSPEFLEFLTRTGDLHEPDKEAFSEWDRRNATFPLWVEWLMAQWESGKEPDPESISGEMQIMYESFHPGVAMISSGGIAAEELGFWGNQLEHLAGPYPVVSSKGQLEVSTSEDFAIPASMKNPDLAWKFISYCIRERDSMTVGGENLNIDGINYFTGNYFTTRIPINKKNVAHEMDFLKSSGLAYQSSALVPTFKRSDINGAMCAQKLDEFLAMPLVNSKTYVIDMSEYLTEFYENKLTTPEQCAEKIQGRMDIWLHE